MNGIHDMGGMHGMGPIEVREDERPFHAGIGVQAVFVRRHHARAQIQRRDRRIVEALARFLTVDAPTAIVAGEAVPPPLRKARRLRYFLF